MGLSINTAPSSGEGFTPYIKYDARAGRMIRPDRAQDNSGQWVTDLVDVTQGFSAVFDLANLEEGWINFPQGSAPDFRMQPLGGKLPPAPSPQHKEGIRMHMKLSKDSGGDVRVFSSSAKVVTGAINVLYGEYEKGVKANPGMLPVVALVSTLAVTSGSGTKKSTNYAPTLKIERWVNPPADLLAVSNDNEPQKASGNVVPLKTPPSTGSTKVSAPQQKAAPAGDAEDFG